MRWFKGNAEAPRLLSLSPLRGDDDIEGESLHIHGTTETRDMSPVRWSRRKSSGSESERNCYNVQTSQVTTEKCPSKKDKKKIQEERRRSCEKRNPLLDRVKNTRLSFFKDKLPDDDFEEDERSHFRSMCDLDKRNLMRSDFRRSVCEIDLKKITEEEKTQAKRKRRSKSHTRVSARKNTDERFSFLGFGGSSTSQKSCWSNEQSEIPKVRKSFHVLQSPLKACERTLDSLETDETEPHLEGSEGSQFDSVTPSSCLAAKFRAMQDRYLKSSTNRLIAKIYRRDGKDRDKRRLRSFSYGTLPGLDELRTNPLFEDQDQDDNDSGILDNGSATSSLLDDRCSSGASGLITSMISDLPPQLPPRKPSSSITDFSPDLGTSLVRKSSTDLSKHHTRMIMHNASLGIEKNPLGSLNQATNDEVIERHGTSGEQTRIKEDKRSKQLSVVTSRSYTTENMVVKLPRETVDQSLGIFIAKTVDSSPGYLVAHVVPNGLADKEGTLKIGDEILIVNGKRLRGLDMGEARKVLGSGNAPGEVDIVISRYTSVEPIKRLKESSVDYENVSMEHGQGIILENASSPKSHFRKHHSRHHRERKSESNRSISSEKSNSIEGTQVVSNFCTLPRRPRSSVSSFHTVVFEKGPGKKSLGFTIVGGRDSPKGSIGIFIKSVLPGGQAAEDGRLRAGDEILAVNGQVSHDLTHREAVQLFRSIKSGPLALHLCRRVKQRDAQITKAKSCADLLLVDS
ncbi:pro-interleukin-16 isoform X1 [Fopius arisanus]|uniref:Pdzd2_0 protein n=2 Tax=Fopius arisanus TaxID=64838 RepID=A0A0C9QGF9_9HYME|nr:PREDICTED: pro-interleukin-16-like isoform X1 [Fopius arisanus]XP_011300700.1 PREDICTED: pro-interleukin-16-like isoform X1 [Fopius arisanus]